VAFQPLIKTLLTVFFMRCFAQITKPGYLQHYNVHIADFAKESFVEVLPAFLQVNPSEKDYRDLGAEWLFG
jgi:hypothetical protein